jgi:hypothetical protein
MALSIDPFVIRTTSPRPCSHSHTSRNKTVAEVGKAVKFVRKINQMTAESDIPEGSQQKRKQFLDAFRGRKNDTNQPSTNRLVGC